MAMPVDTVVTDSNGDQEVFYAALESRRGETPRKNTMKRTLLPDHRWVDPTYTFVIPERLKKIVKIEIDPTQRMADQDWENNVWEIEMKK